MKNNKEIEATMEKVLYDNSNQKAQEYSVYSQGYYSRKKRNVSYFFLLTCLGALLATTGLAIGISAVATASHATVAVAPTAMVAATMLLTPAATSALPIIIAAAAIIATMIALLLVAIIAVALLRRFTNKSRTFFESKIGHDLDKYIDNELGKTLN